MRDPSRQIFAYDRILESPPHHLDLSLAIFVQVNHWLHGLRTEIVAGFNESLIQSHCHGERLCDSLFVRASFVSSTHG